MSSIFQMSLRDTRKVTNVDAKRQGFVEKIESDYKQHGKNAMKKVKTNNIMIIGRARSGKSTIKSVILDPTIVPDELTLKCGTRDPVIESFHIADIDATLNIIDTPGLFERGGEEDSLRDNDAILTTIEKCANMEITSFNVICFCVSITAGINGEDVRSIELFMKFLGDEISSNSCLIITRCESKNEEQRNKIKKELEEDKFFKKIAPFFKLGVFFSGSINRDNCNNGNECILDEYVTINEYRTKLIKLFTSHIKPFPITETKISEIRRARETNTVILDELQNAQNVSKQQEYANKDLKSKSTQQERLIKDLQWKNSEKDHTINTLQRKCGDNEHTIEEAEKLRKDQRRTIEDLQRKSAENTDLIKYLRSKIAEGDCIIKDLLGSSLSSTTNQLRKKYPDYFSNNYNDAIPRMDDNYGKYLVPKYK